MEDDQLATMDCDADKSRELLNDYFVNDKIADFSQVDEYSKLCLLQKTPAKFIKSRKVGRTMIPYVDHYFAEKALNFVFNFQISSEVVSHEFREIKGKTKDWDRTKRDSDGSEITAYKETLSTEAECLVRFTFALKDGSKIVRDVYSAHKGYSNPATTRGDVLKSAISKAWTVVARQFGIGADLRDKEASAYNRAAKNESYSRPVKKDLGY
jgi:hypothetical protein